VSSAARKAAHPQDGVGQVALFLPVSHAVTESIDWQLHAKPVESAPIDDATCHGGLDHNDIRFQTNLALPQKRISVLYGHKDSDDNQCCYILLYY
jgi:hypothetical protein